MRPIATRAFLALAASASLSACQQPQGTAPRTSVYDTSIQSEIDQQIAGSSARAANAIETLAMVERTRTRPSAPPVDVAALPPELKVPVTMEWSGPADEAVRQLAKKSGYSFRIVGSASSSTPLMADLSLHDIVLGQAFADVGLQVNPFASVVVDPNNRSVEFRNETGTARTTGIEATEAAPAAIHSHHRHAPRKHAAAMMAKTVPATVAPIASKWLPPSGPAAAPADAAPVPAPVAKN